MINSNIIFVLCSFLYIIMISIFYFSKKRVKNYDNRIYSMLLITNMIGLSFELFSAILNISGIQNHFFQFLLFRMINVYFLTWLSLFTYYIFRISIDFDNVVKRFPNIRKILVIIYFIFLFFVLILPLYAKNINGYVLYTYGMSVNFLYVVSFIYILMCLFLFLFNLKRIRDKKFLPLILFFFLGIVVAIVQMIVPELIIISSMEAFVTILMYFTIENPDVKMIQELQVAREQADKANHAKTDFLSSMSHEIRTPLNAIVGFSDCIMDAKDLGEAKENARDIVNASQTLLEIVNGILDISKIEAGKIEIVNSKYDAPETFLELAKLITPKMNEKGLDFSFNIAPDLPKTLFGDHANLKKIVTNLLSNACKYTDRGFVHYEVNCVNTKDVSKLIISVEDSGRGIKKDNIDKMFTKFQRLDEDRNTTIEGTGLGLAITKQLIELMGGRIIVHTVYGQGSKFTVVLNQKITTDDAVKGKKVKSTLDLHDIRILLVDDTPLNLKVASKLLERFNANHIVTANSGFECFDRIKRGEVYDLILLDDMMPKMSGVETLKKLKELPNFNVPTVALTANAISGMREKYLSDGFDDYLAKPIEKDQLIQVVNQILGRSVTEEFDPIQEKRLGFGPVSPSIRDNVIPVEDNKSEKAEIIPVEDNIEELLGKNVERNYEDTIKFKPVKMDDVEVLDDFESVETVKPVDLVPVVNIDVNTNADITSDSSNSNIDRSYLENNGVDVNHALELLGDMEMYNMTINDFMSEVEEKWGRINQYKDSNDMPNYAIEVHSLKSDCKYLGFMTLADISYQHELKSKENDSNFVNEHFDELKNEYEKVLKIAKNYVEHNKVDE